MAVPVLPVQRKAGVFSQAEDALSSAHVDLQAKLSACLVFVRERHLCYRPNVLRCTSQPSGLLWV